MSAGKYLQTFWKIIMLSKLQ